MQYASSQKKKSARRIRKLHLSGRPIAPFKPLIARTKPLITKPLLQHVLQEASSPKKQALAAPESPVEMKPSVRERIASVRERSVHGQRESLSLSHTHTATNPEFVNASPQFASALFTASVIVRQSIRVYELTKPRIELCL